MAVKPSSNNRFGRSLVSDIAGVGAKSNTNKRAMSAADIIKKQQEAVQKAEESQETTDPVVENTVTETEKTIEKAEDAKKLAPEVDKNNEVIAKTEPQTEKKEESVNKTAVVDVPSNTVSEPIASAPDKKESVTENRPESLDMNTTVQTKTDFSNNAPYNTTPIIEKPGVNANLEADRANSNNSAPIQQLNQTYQQPYMNAQPYGYQQPGIYNQNNYGMSQPNYYGNYQDNYQPVNQNMGYTQDIQNAELHKTTNFSIFEDYPDINVRLPIKTGGDREMLKKSILESGIADPIIVAPVNDVIRAFQAVQFPVPNYPSNVQFIIIAGQNRRSIAKELNIELPFIIKRGLNKEQMDAIGLDTNLLNRQFSAMKPSEQVYIVNRRRALFEQNNTRNIRGKLSEITGYEKTYIYQLLSLVNVKRELLTDFVDQGYISVSGITHLVSVPFSNQELLYDYLIRYNIKKLMANQMKALLQDTTTEWNDQYLSQVLFPNTKKLTNITIRPDQYQNLIPEEDLPKATEIIIAALKQYYKKS